MALLKNIQDDTLQVYTYHKIANVRINTYGSYVTFELHSFKDMESRNTQARPIVFKSYDFGWEPNQNTIEASYLYLKTLPDFTGAEDC